MSTSKLTGMCRWPTKPIVLCIIFSTFTGKTIIIAARHCKRIFLFRGMFMCIGNFLFKKPITAHGGAATVYRFIYCYRSDFSKIIKVKKKNRCIDLHRRYCRSVHRFNQLLFPIVFFAFSLSSFKLFLTVVAFKLLKLSV